MVTNRYFRYQQVDDPARVAAGILASEGVIAWFQGGSEFGPRALGHRCFLADPRPHKMRSYLNSIIKHREWFRPFAPSALEEEADKYFDLIQPSRYMLTVSNVLPSARESVPAIVHVDGTSRVQTVPQSIGRYRRLLENFHRETGIPLVLDTSLNLRGEPIVETPREAVDLFLRVPADALVIEDFVVHHTPLAKRLLVMALAKVVEVHNWAEIISFDARLAHALLTNTESSAATDLWSAVDMAHPNWCGRGEHYLSYLADIEELTHAGVLELAPASKE